jgi:hypothetical protein
VVPQMVNKTMNHKAKYTKQYFKRFSFKIGNNFDNFQIFEILNNEKELKIGYDFYRTARGQNEKIIKSNDFSTILQKLANLNFEDWDKKYSNKIYDGIDWKLEAYFKQSIVCKKEGSNNFPHNINALVEFIKSFFPNFNMGTKVKNKLSEKDLLRLYCLKHQGTSFSEVSVGNQIIAKNSTDRRLDIVRIENDHYKWYRQYAKNKDYFQEIVSNNIFKIELVEIKTKLNRCVIGQLLVGEYLFKKKFNVEKVSLAILYHTGDELLEMFCKEKGIRLIQY